MLTAKQERFCIEYAKSGNARQSYINAGYRCKDDNATDAAASRLLSNVKVKLRLAELTEEVKNESIADIEEMQKVLTEIIRQGMKEEVVVSNSIKGTFEKTEKKPAIKDIINAINTLGKMQGAFVDKVEAEVDISPIVIKDNIVE